MNVTPSIKGLVEKVGVVKLRKSLGTLCACMPSDGKVSLGVAAIALAPLTGGASFIVAMVAAGVALQLSGTREQQEQQRLSQQEQMKEFCARVEACGDDPEQVAGVVTEAAGEDNPLLVRLAGYDRADLAARVAEDVKKELAPLLPEGSDLIDWGDVASFLDKNNELLVSLQTQMQEVLAKLDEIGSSTARLEDGQQRTHKDIQSVKEETKLITLRQNSQPSIADVRLIVREEVSALNISASTAPSGDHLEKQVNCYCQAVEAQDDTAAAAMEPKIERLFVEIRLRYAWHCGHRHTKAERHDQATVAYRVALGLRPSDPDIMTNLAFALQNTRKSSQYGASLREAERLLATANKIRKKRAGYDSQGQEHIDGNGD